MASKSNFWKSTRKLGILAGKCFSERIFLRIFWGWNSENSKNTWGSNEKRYSNKKKTVYKKDLPISLGAAKLFWLEWSAGKMECCPSMTEVRTGYGQSHFKFLMSYDDVKTCESIIDWYHGWKEGLTEED